MRDLPIGPKDEIAIFKRFDPPANAKVGSETGTPDRPRVFPAQARSISSGIWAAMTAGSKPAKSIPRSPGQIVRTISPKSCVIVGSQIDRAIVIYQSKPNSIQPACTPQHVLDNQRICEEVDH